MFGTDTFRITKSCINFKMTKFTLLYNSLTAIFKFFQFFTYLKGGLNRKESLKKSKLQRALHQNWTWASKRGRPSRSASEWVFNSTTVQATLICSLAMQWLWVDFILFKIPNFTFQKYFIYCRILKRRKQVAPKHVLLREVFFHLHLVQKLEVLSHLLGGSSASPLCRPTMVIPRVV